MYHTLIFLKLLYTTIYFLLKVTFFIDRYEPDVTNSSLGL